MDLTTGERMQLRQILQNPMWQTVERLATLLCDKISYETKTKESQWDTIKATIGSESEIRGIKRFIQSIYEQAQQ